MLNLSNQRNDVHAERMGTRRTESAPRAVERLQISRVCKIYRSHSILLELETWTGGGVLKVIRLIPTLPIYGSL